MTFCIYTIGYGNRSISEFIQILKDNQIQVVVDVRSIPYSRYRPAFNSNALEKHLVDSGISYMFKGNELGGLPKDPNLQTDNLPDYEKIRKTLPYQQGLSDLECGIELGYRIALLCACLHHKDCHRNKLIGKDLAEKGITVLHINKAGGIEAQTSSDFL
ncbi:hypothetical protein FLACOL_01577 [Flavobacterium columnare]|uniref:DUF488 domain-containing protein n=2 Tax=Flavobacterium TaxID=237 RepID=A0ABW8PN72_9FLAO|nr:DUF488 domain-containing protein [Flavobacterium columnare]SPE77581.1 hypothetical protein FLACOL_01577 [Flavobacterium columnare]